MSTDINNLLKIYQTYLPDLEWKDSASCADLPPDLFFPEDAATVRKAKSVCEACPVRPECLRESLSGGTLHGIWGGYGLSVRQRLKKQFTDQTNGRLAPVDDIREWLDALAPGSTKL